jgi:hypothetical protein
MMEIVAAQAQLSQRQFRTLCQFIKLDVHAVRDDSNTTITTPRELSNVTLLDDGTVVIDGDVPKCPPPTFLEKILATLLGEGVSRTALVYPQGSVPLEDGTLVDAAEELLSLQLDAAVDEDCNDPFNIFGDFFHVSYDSLSTLKFRNLLCE